VARTNRPATIGEVSNPERPNIAIHVAGRGLVTGFGAGRCRTLDAVFSGSSSLRARDRTRDVDVPCRVVAEAPFDVTGDFPPSELPFRLARRAAREACAEARVDPNGLGLVLASTKADLSGVVGPGTGLGRPATLARRLAQDLGIAGEVQAVSCACASGLAALSHATRRPRAG